MNKAKNPPISSDFEKGLTPLGRILEHPDYNVWGCSPIYDDEGRVHVFILGGKMKLNIKVG